jgi:hypothetical protein
MEEPISYEIVTKTWERMADTPVYQAEGLIHQMERQQPNLLAYLLAQDEEIFSQPERETILYVGMVIWQVMKQGKRKPRKVTQKKIFEAEEVNYDFLEQLSEDTEGDFMSATLAMLENYAEPEVFRYIVEAIMEDEADDQEEDSPMQDENRGLAFLILKTALDALIASRKAPAAD